MLGFFRGRSSVSLGIRAYSKLVQQSKRQERKSTGKIIRAIDKKIVA